MKKLNFREVIFSTLAGAMLALFFVLSAVSFTHKASADGAGDYCMPPAGCNTLGCATRTDGVKYCVNYGSQGGTCASNNCLSYPGEMQLE